MRLLLSIIISICLATSVQAQPSVAGPISFENFFKDGMKYYDGFFPVYEHQGSYYLEIRSEAMQQRVLMLGDAPTASGTVAKSSSYVRFIKSPKGDGLQLQPILGGDLVEDNAPRDVKDLVAASNLSPIGAMIPAVAQGRTAGSLIINITSILTSGGNLLNFQNVGRLSKPDQTRSMIDKVLTDPLSAVFSMRWSQTDKNPASNMEMPTTSRVFLGLFAIKEAVRMPLKLSDSRIGFKSFQRIDYSRYKYYAAPVNYVQRWDLGTPAKDKSKSRQVKPSNPITVVIDSRIPSHYKKYVLNSVKDWAKAFHAAGWGEVFKLDEQDLSETMMKPQSILIRWDNASLNRSCATVVDPENGRIIAGKINLGDILIDELALDYIANCGMLDPRPLKNSYDLSMRGDLMQYKTTQLLGEVFGLLPNELASSAYSTQELRDAKRLGDQGPTSSVMDLAFNYVAQPQDRLSTRALIPSVGIYDYMAINWAYPATDKTFDESIFYKNNALNPAYLYGAAEANSPWALEYGLASDPLNGVKLGISNLQQFFPQMEQMIQSQKGLSGDWSEYLSLSNAVKRNYKRRIIQAATIVGGRGTLPIRKGYNDTRYRSFSAQEQREAMAFVGQNIQDGLPAWLNDQVAQRVSGSNSESYLQLQNVEVLKALLNISTLDNLIALKSESPQDYYAVEEFFQALDHYVFMDFDKDREVSAYHRLLQFNYLNIVLQLVKTNKLEAGLSPSRSLLGGYFNKITAEINRLATQHADVLSRDNYNLMKIYIQNNYVKS